MMRNIYTFIPSVSIGEMQVVTGGASAAWGSDAVAGVVNLIHDRSLERAGARRRGKRAALWLGVCCGLLMTWTGATAEPAGEMAPSLKVRQMFGVKSPMRDGVNLVSDIYLPGGSGKHPVVLLRSPYQRNQDYYEPHDVFVKYAYRLAELGIGFVSQDTRGRGDSEGEFEFFFREGEDTHDTVEWIARQPWSNGQVAMIGGSYKGGVQWLGAREQPEHLTCLFAQSPGAEYFDEIPYQGGMLMNQWSLTWPNLTSGRLNQDVPQSMTDWATVLAARPLLTQDVLMGRELPLRRQFLAHQTLDSWWRRIFFSDADFTRMDVPAFHVSGWYDGQLTSSGRVWTGMRAHSPARDRQYLLIGPWLHHETRTGGTPTLNDQDRTAASVMDIDALSIRWFKSCFEGTTDKFDWPRARLFVTGRNEWMDLEDYPPKQAQRRLLYLHSDGRANSDLAGGELQWKAPGSQKPDRYRFDPRREPVGTPTGKFQSPLSRDDVLVYQTAPLPEDLTVIGHLKLRLFAATSAPNTDFVATLYDVDPEGRALRVNGKTGALRATYRKGYDKLVSMTPGVPDLLELNLSHVGHVFKSGHRIKIDIASAAPPFAPNHNTGNDPATDVEFRTAEQTIYHDRRRPSALELSIVPLDAARRGVN
jgi:putative CocE/NonD family hydrolase